MHEYLKSIINQIRSIYQNADKPVSLNMKVKNITMNIETAIPCGMIINEIATNSFKYAFENIEFPEISILLENDGVEYILTVHDNGSGLPETVSLQDRSGLGLQLVYMLSKQLNGTVQINRESGTEYIIKFSKEEKEEKRWSIKKF